MALYLRLAFGACLLILTFFVEEGLSIGNSEKFVHNGVDVKVFGVVARQRFGGRRVWNTPWRCVLRRRFFSV